MENNEKKLIERRLHEYKLTTNKSGDYNKSYKCHCCGKPTGFYEGSTSGKLNCPHCNGIIVG